MIDQLAQFCPERFQLSPSHEERDTFVDQADGCLINDVNQRVSPCLVVGLVRFQGPALARGRHAIHQLGQLRFRNPNVGITRSLLGHLGIKHLAKIVTRHQRFKREARLGAGVVGDFLV